jgi:hypothetical protein
MRLLAAAALAAVVLAGCAGGEEEASPDASPTELLAQAADRLREQATFTFESTFVRTRADRPNDEETFMEGAGGVDLEQARGRATVELDLGLPDSGSGPGLDDPVTLRWNPSRFEAEIGGEARQMTRGDARENGGLIGRYPDEPEALVELLELGTDARELGDDHVGFTVDARAASRAGAPATGPVDTTLPMEVWVGDDGEPRRIAYRIEQAPTAALPARTIVVTYELADLGNPVSGLEFTSQAG